MFSATNRSIKRFFEDDNYWYVLGAILGYFMSPIWIDKVADLIVPWIQWFVNSGTIWYVLAAI
jgi:hypothetical protein